MTYTSGNPAPMMTPETKLADKTWRIVNSWWIFPPVLSLGFLGWLGFLVAAIRTGKKKYWIFTAIYAAMFGLVVILLSTDEDGLARDLAIVPILGSWLGPTIHAAIWNREYLRTLAAKGAWYQTPAIQATHMTQPPQSFLGVSQNNYYAPNAPAAEPQPAPTTPTFVPPPHQHQPAAMRTPQPASGSIHVNTATAETLAQLPGVGQALAQRVIAVRDARGGYRNIDDLTAAANLQPHEVVRLRNHLTFDQNNPSQPPHDTPTQPGATGRILDI